MNSVIRGATRCGALVSTFFCALLLGVYALPAGAAAKSITFSVGPSPLPAGPSIVEATITNNGNSNANSFEVDWTSPGGFTVNSASAGTGSNAGVCSVSGLNGRCVFTQQLPVKTSVTVRLNVTVAAASQCVARSVNWFAYAWTGAPGPLSQSFTLAPGPYTTALSSAPTCTITFDKPPKDAFIGSIITSVPFDSSGAFVTVRLVQGATPQSGITVSLTSFPASPACATSPTRNTDSAGIATFEMLKGGAATDTCRLTASAPGFGDSAPSAPFRVVEPLGILDCTKQTEEALGANGASAIGTRLNNTDGECPLEIPYVLFWRDLGDGKQDLQFIKDDRGQPVAMSFEVTWPNEPAPTVPAPNYGFLGAITLSLQEFVVLQPEPIDLCVGTPDYDGLGLLTSLAPPIGGFPDLGLPGGSEYGCVYDRDITYPTPPTGSVPLIGLKEFIYLQGDWGASRTNQ